MVGLGESFDEMVDTLGTLRDNHVQVLTVGQYLRPTENHLPIVRYWHPDEFKELERAAYALGFEHVAAGPLVRSSYHADEHVPQHGAGHRPACGGDTVSRKRLRDRAGSRAGDRARPRPGRARRRRRRLRRASAEAAAKAAVAEVAAAASGSSS